ncbi:MAG: tetratricopeptide repeat protein [Myxococcales bacterium]|nr:tetratricopeptide repeat protein [Myxococcales bacterium]
MRAAILATGAPTAERAAERSDPTLDDFARRWRETHAATCEAAHLRGELTPELLDLRETCLERHLVGASAVIDTIIDADAGVVERIHDLLRTLPRPERCTDLAYLARLSPGTSSAAARAETEAITRDLMRIRASANAGRFADAQEHLRPILTAAEALANRRLLAQVRGLEGRLAADLGDMATAEEAYLVALGHALASDADDDAAETANALVYLYGYYLSNRVEAGRWIKVAAGLIDRTGNDDLRMQHLNYVGALQSQASEYAEALATFDQAAALAASLGASPHDLASIANNRGVILNYLGRRAEAKEAHRAAIDALISDLGEVHPDVAMTRNSLGTVLLAEGDLDGALAQFTQALELQERLIGPDHPLVALTLVNLGSTHVERGELEQGLAEGERALRILAGAGLGPDHLFAGYAHLVIGDARGRAGLAGAREASARALKILEETLGPEHAHVGVVLLSLAALDLEEGDPEAARAELERAAPILAASHELGEADLARAEFLNARVHAARREIAAARATGRRAEARLAPLAPHYASQRAAIQRWLTALPPA